MKAEAYLRQGNSQQALELVSSEPPSGAPVDISARSRILRGEALCRLGRPHEAEPAFADAEQLASPARRELQGELALARGRCALSVNRNMAKQYFMTAAELAHGGDRVVEGTALLNVGFVLLQDQHYDEAVNELNEALRVTDSRYVNEKALGNLGFARSQLGDFRQSISLAEQAETLAEQIKAVGDQEKWLLDLGRAHLVLTEYTLAEPYYSQALSIARSRKDTDTIGQCLNNLTQLALRRHDLKAAENYWKEEASLSLGADGRAYASFDAATIAKERKDFSTAERLFKGILETKVRDSLRLTTERELGNVYWLENKTAEADKMFRKAIQDAEAVIAHLPPQYQMSFLDEDPFYDSYMRFLTAQGKSRDALGIAERGRGQVLSRAMRESRDKPVAFDLAAVQAVLKRRNQVALAYSLADDESFLWVITPNEFQQLHLPSHKLLRTQIDACNREIQNRRSIEASPAGEELYKTLVQPAERLVPKGSSVVIVPSKLLSLVNFEALIVPGPQLHYWIDDVDIQVTGSLTLYAAAKSPARKSGQGMKELLALGAPLEASKEFPTLKHAADEMQRVQNHFPRDQATLISGQEATPEAYRASNPGHYRFLHLDTHGVASDLSPLESAIILSPGKNNSYKLPASDIKDIPLRADLVTISACYGAGTRWYQGEGLVGLAWAFLHAGAHQVVGALWEVDEASSPQLMDDFYGELAKGKSAAEALRAAKLRMLHSGGSYSHPYYWASLQVYTGA